jgi:hypothetical protein
MDKRAAKLVGACWAQNHRAGPVITPTHTKKKTQNLGNFEK